MQGRRRLQCVSDPKLLSSLQGMVLPCSSRRCLLRRCIAGLIVSWQTRMLWHAPASWGLGTLPTAGVCRGMRLSRIHTAGILCQLLLRGLRSCAGVRVPKRIVMGRQHTRLTGGRLPVVSCLERRLLSAGLRSRGRLVGRNACQRRRPEGRCRLCTRLLLLLPAGELPPLLGGAGVAPAEPPPLAVPCIAGRLRCWRWALLLRPLARINPVCAKGRGLERSTLQHLRQTVWHAATGLGRFACCGSLPIVCWL